MHSSDTELIEDLLNRWHEKRREVEEMLCDHFNLDSINDIGNHCNAPQDSIPPWGLILVAGRVDLSQPNNVDGIRYHYQSDLPSDFELRDFLIKQYNAGKLTKKWWRPLMLDEQRFYQAVHKLCETKSLPIERY